MAAIRDNERKETFREISYHRFVRNDANKETKDDGGWVFFREINWFDPDYLPVVRLAETHSGGAT